MAQDFDKVRAKTIARAWKDPRFKEKLLKNPKAALKEMGWDVPAEFDVRTLEDNQNSYTLVLPPAVANAHELSDQQLEKLVGGVRPGGGGHWEPKGPERNPRAPDRTPHRP